MRQNWTANRKASTPSVSTSILCLVSGFVSHRQTGRSPRRSRDVPGGHSRKGPTSPTRAASSYDGGGGGGGGAANVFGTRFASASAASPLSLGRASSSLSPGPSRSHFAFQASTFMSGEENIACAFSSFATNTSAEPVYLLLSWLQRGTCFVVRACLCCLNRTRSGAKRHHTRDHLDGLSGNRFLAGGDLPFASKLVWCRTRVLHWEDAVSQQQGRRSE